MTALTIGPLLFHWAPQKWLDFYARIADEAPVDTVYLGEVICSKRAPFIEPLYESARQRLTAGGKSVVMSGLAEVMTRPERRMAEKIADYDDLVEANETATLYHLQGRPFACGPYLNVYNELTLRYLAGLGATHVTLPPELRMPAIRTMAAAAKTLDLSVEVQVFGRIPLALSARCYHARAHGRVKNNCRFVCREDPDGMGLRTLDKTPFLAINGIQTLSHACLNLMAEMPVLSAAGVDAFRLSPHTCDMVRVSEAYRAVADGHMAATEGIEKLGEISIDAPFANGFIHGQAGHVWLGDT
ncbi:MAG: U32 family peptidase [Alphaproteobacteria bacterium]